MDDIKLPGNRYRPSQEADLPTEETNNLRSGSPFGPDANPESVSNNDGSLLPESMTAKPHHFRLHHVNLTKQQKLLTGVGLGLLVVVGAIVTTLVYKKAHSAPKAPNLKIVTVTRPKPTTEPSRLTGVEIPIELNKRPVTAVMIENSPDARPQSGLRDAGVIYEAIAEGGITRFLTLFQEGQPGYIGPVRSVRPYYLDWLMPFDAAVAHAGGSGQALAEVKSLGIKDLDYGANGSAYQRVSSRFAPHNLYTSMGALDGARQAHGFTSSTFSGFIRKKSTKAQPAGSPSLPGAKTIDFNISSLLYNPHYDYDSASKTYKRSEGGKPQTDEKSGAQLTPAVVVALVMSRSQDDIYSVYGTVGSGPMYVFQDGVVTEGTWKKVERKSQFVFNDTGGKPLVLEPGQTWISIVADKAAVTYKP